MGLVALRRRAGRNQRGHHVFEVEVFLNDLDPKAVRVELYANGINGGDPVRQEMKCARPAVLTHRAAASTAQLCPRHVRQRDYTARVIPQCAGVAVPLE